MEGTQAESDAPWQPQAGNLSPVFVCSDRRHVSGFALEVSVALGGGNPRQRLSVHPGSTVGMEAEEGGTW